MSIYAPGEGLANYNLSGPPLDWMKQGASPICNRHRSLGTLISVRPPRIRRDNGFALQVQSGPELGAATQPWSGVAVVVQDALRRNRAHCAYQRPSRPGE